MSRLLDQLGVEAPIVQAGMGGGVSRHELAAAVSEAGGLGTLGILAPQALAKELAAVRGLTGRPVAINLLLPFTRREHRRVAADADLVVTFWGPPKRPCPSVWLHQCGSVEEATAAHAAGADGVIVQGVESGGHVRGVVPGLELLEQARAALPAEYPVMLAGGIADRADVSAALDAGADAAVLGSRFLVSDESRAHPVYKQRLLSGAQTQLTELFGLGRPAAPHRVLPTQLHAAGPRVTSEAHPGFAAPTARLAARLAAADRAPGPPRRNAEPAPAAAVAAAAARRSRRAPARLGPALRG